MNLSAITSFDEKIDPLSMNNSFEAEKIEPEHPSSADHFERKF